MALKMCFALLFALLVSSLYVPAESASIVKRETQTENQTPETQIDTVTTTERPVQICDTNLSCGWAVYAPFTREIKYFMKNSCECQDTHQCVRVDDDSVISAFVYKCRVKRTTTRPPTTTE